MVKFQINSKLQYTNTKQFATLYIFIIKPICKFRKLNHLILIIICFLEFAY